MTNLDIDDNHGPEYPFVKKTLILPASMGKLILLQE
jgi:hypothetical protein